MDRTSANISWATATQNFWGKSSRSVDISWHPLLAHMLDVAAVAEALLRKEPKEVWRWAAGHLGVSQEAVPRWCGLLAGLHDLGKATAGFEAKWEPGKARLMELGLNFTSTPLNRHDIATHALIRHHCRERLPKTLCTSVADALAAHHGFFPSSFDRNGYRTLHAEEGWTQCQAHLVDLYWQALEPGPAPISPSPTFPFSIWMAGLTSVADWIGSSEEYFAPGWRGDTPALHHQESLKLASRALEGIGWPQAVSLRHRADNLTEILTAIVGREAHPRPLQQTGWELLDGVEAPVLMIVEAPMGEGKTELAFLAHLRLQAALGHRGLYMALPTQATGNAMFTRTIKFLQAMSPSIQLDVQLAHGGAALNPEVKSLRINTEASEDALTSSAWFTKRRRALLSPYGVGTVDQLLLGVLNVKHHFVRLFGLGNRVVVLDEVHAYDVYTGGLILGLVKWLRRLGASVVIMSATLPAARRAELLSAWGQEEADIPAADYPRVMVAHGNGQTQTRHVLARELPPVEIRALREDVAALVQNALALAQEGGCGAVIVNTVQRAQAVYADLKALGGEGLSLTLFHARFPANDRQRREEHVLAQFGREGARPAKAILVATQVAEQSLDVDFDFMISDLAPVDLLLQRVGRLHRHNRTRPAAHAVPRLHVAGLGTDGLPELAKTAWEWVYEPAFLLRTWAVMRSLSTITLPGDIDRLVQEVYAEQFTLPPDLPQGAAESLATAWTKAQQEQNKQAQLAEQNLVHAASRCANDAYNTFQMLDEDDGKAAGLIALTRQGSMSATVVPVYQLEDDLVRLSPDFPPLDLNTIPDDGATEQIWMRQVRLSRFPLPKIFNERPAPKGWAKHPLLRGLKPLILDVTGRADFENLTVRFDAELGIVYEKESS